MGRYKLNKTLLPSMEKIPNPTENQNKILHLLRLKYDLKRVREKRLEAARELRKEIYNYSQKINEYEQKIDAYLLETIRGGQNRA